MFKFNDLPSQSPVALSSQYIYVNNARITVLTDCLFRIETSDNKIFEDKATQSIINRKLKEVS